MLAADNDSGDQRGWTKAWTRMAELEKPAAMRPSSAANSLRTA
jgi:hypothetical protein